jgi:hypothetical protein
MAWLQACFSTAQIYIMPFDRSQLKGLRSRASYETHVYDAHLVLEMICAVLRENVVPHDQEPFEWVLTLSAWCCDSIPHRLMWEGWRRSVASTLHPCQGPIYSKSSSARMPPNPSNIEVDTIKGLISPALPQHDSLKLPFIQGTEFYPNQDSQFFFTVGNNLDCFNREAVTWRLGKSCTSLKFTSPQFYTIWFEKGRFW